VKRFAVVAAVAASAGLLAGLRLAGEKSPAFQAAAHLEVGALIVAGYYRWDGVWWQPWTWPFQSVVALILSAIELAAFLFLPK
jgi:hypothetical protein